MLTAICLNLRPSDATKWAETNPAHAAAAESSKNAAERITLKRYTGKSKAAKS